MHESGPLHLEHKAKKAFVFQKTEDDLSPLLGRMDSLVPFSIIFLMQNIGSCFLFLKMKQSKVHIICFLLTPKHQSFKLILHCGRVGS